MLSLNYSPREIFNRLYVDYNPESVLHLHREQPNYAHLVIRDLELNQPIGMLSLINNNPQYLTIQIGLCILWQLPFNP
jgi:hypothetical protein